MTANWQEIGSPRLKQLSRLPGECLGLPQNLHLEVPKVPRLVTWERQTRQNNDINAQSLPVRETPTMPKTRKLVGLVDALLGR